MGIISYHLLLSWFEGVRDLYDGFWIGWLDLLTLIHSQLGTTGNYSAIAILHTSQFTVTNPLGFSVFTSPILATDLSQSHCNFKSHKKSSLHRLIPFLPLFCSCQFRRLDSFQFLYYQVHNPACWCPETRLFTLDSSTPLLPNVLITNFQGSAENTTSIVKDECLLIRCLAVDVLFLRALASAGNYVPSLRLAKYIQVTV
jgi:hypothetical protein